MGFVTVLAAAVAGWLFGAVWYMALSKRWMAAKGMTRETMGKASPAPFIVSFVCAVVVAGMMRHVFVMAGLVTPLEGLMGGAGLGFFIAAPWIVNNVMFSKQPPSLIWIDGGYPALAMSLMGVILTLL